MKVVGSGPLCRIFGVRHLSPAAANLIQRVLEEVRPTAVLVEGPADATDQIKHLVHKDTQPPLALLAYTQDRPVRSILYPLAEYSPEWAALTWAIRNRAAARFIDLPAAVFLELHQLTGPQEDRPKPPENQDRPGGKTGPARQTSEHTRAYLDDPYEAIARLSGEPDHETWWERHFEHSNDAETYRRAILEFGRGLREHRPLENDDENLLREKYMRRCIRSVLAEGHEPDRVLVVCGAFHAPVLTEELEPMSEQEVKSLPSTPTNLTLMPYSYYRLSSQSGYGAGNHAPAYYQLLFEARAAGQMERLEARYLSAVCRYMRQGGQIRSPAEVIEGVRLAQALAALARASAPCLRDLRDAAVTCLGRGDIEAVRPFLHEVEVGHQIGKLPKGVSRTALQDDFYLQLDGLKLARFQTEKAQGLELDLRENRFVKSESAAFLDRQRSTFLHRLLVLGVDFGRAGASRQDQATWKECWQLKWTPDCEIQLVESALKGDSVETATALMLSERLAECQRIDEAAQVVRQAADCELADALENARRRLQAMAVEDNGFVPLGGAIQQLAEVIRYGSVRQVDPEPLRPLLAQLFLRATLLARTACQCDRTAAKEVQPALLILNQVAGEHGAEVDAGRWQRELEGIAAADSLNPYLAGLACALLLESGRIGEDELGREVSRRLSPGVDAELGAGWFEGLVHYNRMALFSRLALWRQLDQYIGSLDEEGFRKALVYLRRAFGDFQAGEVRRVVSNLVQVSSESAQALKTSVDVKLDEDEAKQLQEQLGDLDLGL